MLQRGPHDANGIFSRAARPRRLDHDRPVVVARPARQRGVTGYAQPVAINFARYCVAVKRPFRPRTATVRRVAKSATVLALHDQADGSPGVPPLTATGKQEFAWDRDQGVRPGDPQGHVLFNAHTYPDGSALGNRLLAHLHVGDRIIVRGRWKRQHLCYKVVRRVTVAADKRMPFYYRRDGRPRLAIAVCSGQRLGPGDWTERTVWFAKPIR